MHGNGQIRLGVVGHLQAAQTFKTFGTGILPSYYLEMIKNRLYQGDERASWTLHHILKDFLTAFCPLCPFFSHHISTTLYGTIFPRHCTVGAALVLIQLPYKEFLNEDSWNRHHTLNHSMMRSGKKKGKGFGFECSH